MALEGAKGDRWTEEHEEKLSSFVNEPAERLLVVYVDPINGLTVANAIPPHPVDEIAYFARIGSGVVVTPENFVRTVHYGTLRSNYTESLLKTMQNMYGPMFFQNATWPESEFETFCTEGAISKFLVQAFGTIFPLTFTVL